MFAENGIKYMISFQNILCQIKIVNLTKIVRDLYRLMIFYN